MLQHPRYETKNVSPHSARSSRIWAPKWPIKWFRKWALGHGNAPHQPMVRGDPGCSSKWTRKGHPDSQQNDHRDAHQRGPKKDRKMITKMANSRWPPKGREPKWPLGCPVRCPTKGEQDDLQNDHRNGHWNAHQGGPEKGANFDFGSRVSSEISSGTSSGTLRSVPEP